MDKTNAALAQSYGHSSRGERLRPAQAGPEIGMIERATGEIENAVSSQRGANHQMAEIVKCLYDRLAPILRPSSPSDPRKTPMNEGGSALGIAIAENAEETQCYVEELQSLISRIAL